MLWAILLRMNETAADQSLISGEILEPFCVHGTLRIAREGRDARAGSQEGLDSRI
jgi:hypothetical protein